ncbi:hypothetical protein QAD02_008258 [Eretmocerus hayati]|uniref:Uncharacterized protein n=1 Tax=Eretmocerus hayati TaxID=131215 RepID=A0ACC2N7E8_9HYME|nr:hypothetical protein QAD02_008258 [Eretmocerus hayati]
MILDNEEKLRAALLDSSKRLGAPSMERCQTKNDLDPKHDKSNKENEKMLAKKPRVIKNQTLSEDQRIVLSKIKKEGVDKRKRVVKPKPKSNITAPVPAAGTIGKKNYFDLLGDPCLQPSSGNNHEDVVAVPSTSVKQVHMMSSPVESNVKPPSAKTETSETPITKVMTTSTPVRSSFKLPSKSLTPIQTPIKRSTITSTPAVSNSRSSSSATNSVSSFELDKSFKDNDQVISELRVKLRERDRIIARQAKEIEEMRKNLKNKDDVWYQERPSTCKKT